MEVNSTLHEIEQDLRSNASFLSLAKGNSEVSSISRETDGLYFLLYKNANGNFISYLSEQANGSEKVALDKWVSFTKNLDSAANGYF